MFNGDFEEGLRNTRMPVCSLVLSGNRMLHSSSAQNKTCSVPDLFKVGLAPCPWRCHPNGKDFTWACSFWLCEKLTTMFPFWLGVDTGKELITKPPIGVVPCVKYWQAEKGSVRSVWGHKECKVKGNDQINPRKIWLFFLGHKGCTLWMSVVRDEMRHLHYVYIFDIFSGLLWIAVMINFCKCYVLLWILVLWKSFFFFSVL